MEWLKGGGGCTRRHQNNNRTIPTTFENISSCDSKNISLLRLFGSGLAMCEWIGMVTKILNKNIVISFMNILTTLKAFTDKWLREFNIVRNKKYYKCNRRLQVIIHMNEFLSQQALKISTAYYSRHKKIIIINKGIMS